MAGTYSLEIELFGVYATNMPSLEIWEDGSLNSTHSVSSSGSTISVTISYGGALPASLVFTFNDGFAANGRTIEIRSVRIDNQHINICNYLSTDSLIKDGSATVDVTTPAFLFDVSDPALSEFTTDPTQTMTVGNDTLRVFSSSTDEVFDALAGRDVLYLGSGNDKVFGNAGEDIIYAGAGNDLIFGGDDNDKIYGGLGNDTLYGGGGNDRIHGEEGDDEVYGGAGNDTLNGHAGADTILGGAGDDKINGGDDNDILYGGDDNDQIVAGDGDDTIDSGAGDDLIYGGAGDDLIYGGAGIDYIDGGVGDDYLIGNDGADIINGGAGNDIIFGGDGLDILYGSAGIDTFVFQSATAFNDIDVISDFSIVDNDVLDIQDLLSGYTFGVDNITNFVQILVSGSNSKVFVDVTGLGTFGAVTQVASLSGVTGLTDELALESSGNLVTH